MVWFIKTLLLSIWCLLHFSYFVSKPPSLHQPPQPNFPSYLSVQFRPLKFTLNSSCLLMLMFVSFFFVAFHDEQLSIDAACGPHAPDANSFSSFFSILFKENRCQWKNLFLYQKRNEQEKIWLTWKHPSDLITVFFKGVKVCWLILT